MISVSTRSKRRLNASLKIEQDTIIEIDEPQFECNRDEKEEGRKPKTPQRKVRSHKTQQSRREHKDSRLNGTEIVSDRPG